MSYECECGNKTCFEDRKFGISCSHCWQIIEPTPSETKTQEKIGYMGIANTGDIGPYEAEPRSADSGPSCGSHPYLVTVNPMGGWYCSGSYFANLADAEHQSEKMREAFTQGQSSLRAELEVANKQICNLRKEWLEDRDTLIARNASEKAKFIALEKRWVSLQESVKIKQDEKTLEDISLQGKL